MVGLRSRLGQHAAPRQVHGLTPAQQQSIKLLGLTNLELADLLAEAMAENPLLEPASDLPESVRARLRRPPARRRTPAARPLPAGLSRLFKTTPGRGAVEQGEAAAELADPGPSLEEHLSRQLGADVADRVDRAIGRALIESLDEAGYLTEEVAAVAWRLKQDPGRVERVLERLRGFDPPGVFARDLAECLGLQLADRGRLDPPMRRLLERLDLLAEGAREALGRHCGVAPERLAAMIGELRRLDPRPGLAFDRSRVQTLAPDLSIERGADGGWQVELDDASLPRLAINECYTTGGADAAAAAYLKVQRAAARWLLRALDRRADTLRRVASEIVRRQAAFLDGGVGALKPLSRREIARALDLHESTISRAIAGKHAATPRGVVALADFFAVRLGAGSAPEAEARAPAAVRARLRQVIESESPGRVLSDERLARLLRQEGIELSRRTVAKYREMLRIPPSHRRRRQASL